MTYNHAKNIGNLGDVAKHSVLAAVVKHISSHTSGEFVYAESHTAFAEYTLPSNGKWKDGVGVLSQAIHENCPLPLRAYQAACLANPLQPYDRYPGSSGLVFRLLRNHKPFTFTLHDVNPAACFDLSLYFPFNSSNVRIRREDGIQGIFSIKSASLVLIDPSSLDQRQELIRLLGHLHDKMIPFICWTPRNSGRFENGWNEGKPSSEFYDNTADYSRHRVLWRDNWNGQGMKGCQITVSKPIGDITKCVLDHIKNFMPIWINE